MEIIIARNSGFCYGVKRALHLTRETADKKIKDFYLGRVNS